MNQRDYPVIAREGWTHVTLVLFASLAATYFFGLASFPVWLLAVFVIQFFRDPRRIITVEKGAIVSPASGKIVSICETVNPYRDGDSVFMISVFMNIFSVHSNLIPVAGKVVDYWYCPGHYVNASLDKSSQENERAALHIRTNDKHDVFCVQIAGLIARRIVCHVKPGDLVRIGQRYGFIRFGSRVDLYIPKTSSIMVKLGQKVHSGNDIIGFLPVK
ncbi:MAG: phosphatidylserine decarboxylase [Gammaproteobacteria bacterium]|nr:phosphatidylserine decarboxylase [Gammaproteobacteria bacterium]MCY4312702.1 phosphatidylserine decarboxylase [Gammaproteobacteria bacterium]